MHHVHPFTPFRTGTALLADGWLAATALLILASLAGLPCQAAGPSVAAGFADDGRPGAIGPMRRPQPGPRPEMVCDDAVQPVEIRGPAGMLVSVETATGWSPMRPAPVRLGLEVGAPYRVRVGGIPAAEGAELYPSVRVLAKVLTPPGQAWRFPVEITIDEDDLRQALDGGHVRRVVYASCEPERPDVLPAAWFDVRPGDDALEVARTLGDPVAEVIIGNRLPVTDQPR